MTDDAPDILIPSDLEPARIGKDEMNLSEFPIALLSGRAGEGRKTLKFSDTIIGGKGRPIKREWIVAGSEEFGLPTSSDEDVFIVLLEATKENGFESRTVPISRYEIVQRLGLPRNGKSYQRVKDALDRLSTTQILAKNAFWDRRVKKYTSVSFGIVESYVLYDETPGRKSAQLQFSHLSSFTWSEAIFASFLAGNLKSLDLNRYFQLKSATARRLYRYLDKRLYDKKERFEIGLFRLAHERLGVSRTRSYPSQLKEALAQAHEELIACGFLARVECREGKEGEVLVYYPGDGKKAVSPPPKPNESEKNAEGEAPSLADRLIEMGVGKTAAAKFARETPEEAERQLAFLPYVSEKEIKKTVGAYLTAAIRDGYGPPAGYAKAQKAEERRRKREEDRAATDEDETRRKVLEIRSRLTDLELSAIEAEALERYFKRFPVMRRALEGKLDDPERRRRIIGSETDRLLLERFNFPNG